MKLPATERRLLALAEEISACCACPRLVAWRQQVARDKRRAYRDETYWGRPVPGFGDGSARIVIVGLAPAAHGANRTGRMFTGDRSGDFLYAALHRAGLASQPVSTAKNDGLALRDVFITAPCRCAPPDNAPTPAELRTCRPWFRRELGMLPRARVFLALGKIGYDALTAAARETHPRAERSPPFAHGVATRIGHPTGRGEIWLLASYHVSQQNTQTGRLTPAMFDAVVRRAVELAAVG
ncbi:MAG: uracil-DNA glycosylase [Polyangiaceae bacterium]